MFTDIYAKNLWRGAASRSGTGSDLLQTEVVREELPTLFRKHEICSLLDVPCGDFYWMSHVDLAGLYYTGADIVSEIVDRNQNLFGRCKLRFVKLDVTRDRLPSVDLILCRDCLVHLSFDEIEATLSNMVSSGSKYLLMTTFTDRVLNADIKTGGWRVLNFEKPPFSLPPPLALINENCSEDGGKYRDKSLGLWEMESVRLAFTTN